MIGVSLDRTSVAAGELLTGTIHWAAEEERRARSVHAFAIWRTEGGGNIARGIARVARFAVRGGDREATIPFRLLIPYEGPVSFAGELITLVWTLRVRFAQPGLDEFIDAEFRVVPRGSGS